MAQKLQLTMQDNEVITEMATLITGRVEKWMNCNLLSSL